MKTRKLYKTGITALALILMLAACDNLTGPKAGGVSGEPIPEGMGMARIQLNAGESARTAVPAMGAYYFTLEFTAPEKTTVNEVLSGGMSVTVALEPAVWTLEVKGYADSSKTDLKLTGRVSVPITEGTASSFEVYLMPEFSSGGTGSLFYNIRFPATVSRGFFALYPMDASETSREIDISGAWETASDTLSYLPQGSYRAVVDLYDGAVNKAAAWTGAVHISGGFTTTLTHTFSTGDFAECGPLVTAGTNTLAAKLNAALASPSGTYTIALNGTETDLGSFSPKTLNVTGSKNIRIAIRGNGRTVQLGSNGSLFTLGAASGASLSLELHDLTLQGLGSNTAPLAQVNTRGTLAMKAGSLIAYNRSSSGGGVGVRGGTFNMNGGAVSSTSGGVFVESGAFNMSGGAVSGNNAGNGGGVYVSGGTFSMSGGAVSNNTAYFYSSSYPPSSGGGGVYVDSSGTFIMSGGAVSNNTTSSSASDYHLSSVGGGVYVVGTFAMSGGVISDNASCGGSGVYVDSSGTFSMSGGAVSNNTTTYGYGGGVYVNGAFAMSGGVVSGNAVYYWGNSSIGGGVCIWYGTFTMSGGVVSGNTASYGGGVFVYNDATFIMRGGSVNNNILYDMDGGREVMVSGGTFKISGDAQPERVLLSLYYKSPFIAISGPLSGGTIPIDMDNIMDFVNQRILRLDNSYSSGNLANLKAYFTLGNSTWTGTPIMGYRIDNSGFFVEE
jgi:hypothetical protein